MTPISAEKLELRPGLRVGEIHTLALADGEAGIDIAAASFEGKPGIVIWSGDASEPTFVAMSAVPALMSILADETLKASA